MNENLILKCRVYAWLCWACVLAFMTAAWMVAAFDPRGWHVAALLALSGCATSAAAATLHIRSFMVRLSSLVRATSFRQFDAHGLRPVR